MKVIWTHKVLRKGGLLLTSDIYVLLSQVACFPTCKTNRLKGWVTHSTEKQSQTSRSMGPSTLLSRCVTLN